MTKTQVKKQLTAIKKELQWLARMEKIYNPDYMFISFPYSKRKTRLIKMYWIMKGAL